MSTFRTLVEKIPRSTLLTAVFFAFSLHDSLKDHVAPSILFMIFISIVELRTKRRFVEGRSPKEDIVAKRGRVKLNIYSLLGLTFFVLNQSVVSIPMGVSLRLYNGFWSLLAILGFTVCGYWANSQEDSK